VKKKFCICWLVRGLFDDATSITCYYFPSYNSNIGTISCIRLEQNEKNMTVRTGSVTTELT
jgi:hypothetical protein